MVLSAVPPHGRSRPTHRPARQARLTSADAAFAAFVRLAEPGADAWGVTGSLRSWSLGFGPVANDVIVWPPTFPWPPNFPWPWPLPPTGTNTGGTDAGTTTSDPATSGATTASTDTGSTDGSVGPPPVGWPPEWPWPPTPWWPPTGTDTGGSGTSSSTATTGASTGDDGGLGDTGSFTTGATDGGFGDTGSFTTGGTDGGSTDVGPTDASTSTTGTSDTGSLDTGTVDPSTGGDTGTDTDGTTATLTTGGITGGVITTSGDDTGGTAGTTGTGGGTTGSGPETLQYYGGPWSFYFDAKSLKHNENVSGTNVEIRPKIVWKWNAADGDRGLIKAIFVAQFDLLFMDHNKPTTIVLPVGKWISEPAYGQTTATDECTGAKLRFASTNFPAGAIPVAIIAETVAQTPEGLIYDPYCIAAFSPIAYNKGLTLSSNQESGDPAAGIPPHSYGSIPSWDFGPNGPGEFGNTQTASRTAADARTAFPRLNHSLVNQSDQLRKSALLADLGKTTAFFGMTHGSPDGIEAYGEAPDYVPLTEHASFLTDILGAIVRPTSVPGMNMVLMESCDTVPELASEVPGSITDAYIGFFGPIPNLDTAYAGMYQNVSTKTNTGQGLDKHAETTYDLLSQGYTIQEATDIANLAYGPRYTDANGVIRPSPMVYSGDGFARLMTVYTGKATPGYDPTLHMLPDAPTAWYKVLP